MHSQPSLFRKVQSEKQRTKFEYKSQYKIQVVSAQPQLELGYKSSTILRERKMFSLLLERRKIEVRSSSCWLIFRWNCQRW